MTFGEVRTYIIMFKTLVTDCLYAFTCFCHIIQIQEDAYQEDLGFSSGQLGKGGVSGPVRGPTVDKKTQVSISKRLQVCLFVLADILFSCATVGCQFKLCSNKPIKLN